MERKEIVYIIPANAKRSQLILGYFRPIDLGIFLAGVCLTLLLLVVIPGNNFELVLIKLIPAGIATFLVIPLPDTTPYNSFSLNKLLLSILLNKV